MIDITGIETWLKIANEGDSFTVNGERVRYGVGNNWVELQDPLTGTFECTTQVFGSDPAPYIVKRCEKIVDDTVNRYDSNIWTQVADEGTNDTANPNEMFTVNPGTLVRYGADTRSPYATEQGFAIGWTEKVLSGTNIKCCTATFGEDPAPYTHKTCQILGTNLASLRKEDPVSTTRLPISLNFVLPTIIEDVVEIPTVYTATPYVEVPSQYNRDLSDFIIIPYNSQAVTSELYSISMTTPIFDSIIVTQVTSGGA